MLFVKFFDKALYALNGHNRMATYNSTKICYKYNKETHIYEGVEEAQLDLHSLRVSKTPKYVFPECTSGSSGSVIPNILSINIGDTIQDNQLLLKCVDYNSDYLERKSLKDYDIGDFFNISNNTLVKSFKVIETSSEHGYTFVEPPVLDDNGAPLIEEGETLVFNSLLEYWSPLPKYEAERPKLVKASNVCYSDMNTRFMDYEEDKFLTSDAKAVFQSIYRLITTDAGEIPYYRSYGCNLKRFVQKPLTEQTANLIYNYLKDKVEEFEPRGRIISSEVGADLNNNILRMKLYVQCVATGETGVVPDLYVKVNRNRR